MTDAEFQSIFEDSLRACCTEENIEDLVIVGDLPDGTTVEDMNQAMDAARNCLFRHKSKILGMANVDASTGDLTALDLRTQCLMAGEPVSITVSVVYDAAYDNFVVNSSFAVLTGEDG